MAFFVSNTLFMEMSGRDCGRLYQLRQSGEVAFHPVTGTKKFLYDTDHEMNSKYLNKMPPNFTAEKKKAIYEARRRFKEDRDLGMVLCALTGENSTAPAKVAVGEVESLDEDQLSRRKRELEVQKLEQGIKKIDMDLKAVAGDFIDRTYVKSYNQQYLGILHQQHLDFASGGICDDIYNLIKQEEPGTNTALKALEHLLEKRLSQLLKDSVQSMKENPL